MYSTCIYQMFKLLLFNGWCKQTLFAFIRFGFGRITQNQRIMNVPPMVSKLTSLIQNLHVMNVPPMISKLISLHVSNNLSQYWLDPYLPCTSGII